MTDQCEICGRFVGHYPVGFCCDTHCRDCTCNECGTPKYLRLEDLPYRGGGSMSRRAVASHREDVPDA